MSTFAATRFTAPLPQLARLAGWLRFRATCGLLAQSLLMGAGVAVLCWGLATGILREENGWPAAVGLGLITTVVWAWQGRRRLHPLPLLTQAERQLRLHELWTTAWTLPAAPVTPRATATPAAEFRAQIESRAEAAAQAAAPSHLLPLRLPAYWNLALVLAVIGLGAGLRPQPAAEFRDADPAQLAGAPDDSAPGGGGPANAQIKPPVDPAQKPSVKPPATPVLTPAQADLQKQWDDLVQRLDTPEKLKAALAQFALLQQQKLLPADAIAAIEKRLREKEKALAAAGNRPATNPGDTPPNPGPPPGEPFAAIPLIGDDSTINSTILQEIRVQYPEYEAALTRYVGWLAEHGKPVEAAHNGTP